MQKPMSQSNGALPPPVAVRELRKVYRDIAAVDGISFTLQSGAITALLGGNGAGKTTTIAMLMGLVVPTSGEARVFGADMARERHKVLHRMNFESPYVDVPMRLTVRQNLEVFARLYGVRDRKGRIAEIAEDFKLAELLDRPYGKLSAGQKTRVSIAKALLNEPELLLLDEPTASLDPDTADWVRAKLERYCRRYAATRSFWPPTTWRRSSALPTGSSCWRRAASSPTRRQPSSSSASAAPIWRRCSSPLPAAAPKSAEAAMRQSAAPRPRLARARADDAGRIGWPHLRPGAALLVRDPLVLAARRRAHLLAAGADADVGLPAELPGPDLELCRQGRRPLHRRRAALGHPGAQPARIRRGVSGGDLVAQPRPPDDEPAPALRVHRRARGGQPHQAAGGHGAGGDACLLLLRLQCIEPGLRVRRVLCQPRHHELVAGPGLDRRRAALGAGRGELRLAHRVHLPADLLRLLSRSPRCPTGCSPLRWPCRPPTYSRACAPSCSTAPSSAT